MGNYKEFCEDVEEKRNDSFCLFGLAVLILLDKLIRLSWTNTKRQSEGGIGNNTVGNIYLKAYSAGEGRVSRKLV